STNQSRSISVAIACPCGEIRDCSLRRKIPKPAGQWRLLVRCHSWVAGEALLAAAVTRVLRQPEAAQLHSLAPRADGDAALFPAVRIAYPGQADLALAAPADELQQFCKLQTPCRSRRRRSRPQTDPIYCWRPESTGQRSPHAQKP